MSKVRTETRLRVAARMAERLGSTEAAVDTALAALGHFLADIPQARLEAQVAAPFGHQIYTELAGAYQMMVESRGRVVAAHALLEDARGDLRLPRMDVMPGADKPPTGLQERPALSVVGAA